MDTVYYTLNTKKVKVAGGADLLTLVPTAVPAPIPAGTPAPAGEVLDFDRCRRRLETKSAWKALAQAAEVPDDLRDEAPEEASEELLPAAEVPSPKTRKERMANWMELAASAAVIFTGVCAGLSFLSML